MKLATYATKAENSKGRIIHTELQKSETVTTTSKGTEPARYIVILPKREESSENEEQDS